MAKRMESRNPGRSGPAGLVASVMILVAAGAFAKSARGSSLRSETVRAWQTYVERTEERIASELESDGRFLVQEHLSTEDAANCRARVMGGDICVLKMKTLDADGTDLEVPSGMVHHWLGSIFIPDVDLDQVLSWVQNYDEHERYFEEVEESALLARQGDVFEILLRLKRQKVVTVHYNTTHRVEYRHHDSKRVSSKIATTRIAQLDEPGTPGERERPIGNDNGFLWRMNSYWRYREVDGGVIVEAESLSLSRDVPLAVRWLVGPLVNSVPRESMESTLGSLRRGVAMMD